MFIYRESKSQDKNGTSQAKKESEAKPKEDNASANVEITKSEL